MFAVIRKSIKVKKQVFFIVLYALYTKWRHSFEHDLQLI